MTKEPKRDIELSVEELFIKARAALAVGLRPDKMVGVSANQEFIIDSSKNTKFQAVQVTQLTCGIRIDAVNFLRGNKLFRQVNGKFQQSVDIEFAYNFLKGEKGFYVKCEQLKQFMQVMRQYATIELDE